MKGWISLSSSLLSLGCAESPVLLTEPADLANQPSQLQPAAGIALASSGAPVHEFDIDDAHVRVFRLGSDAEIEIRYDNSGLAPASVPGVSPVTYVIARNDTIYGMSSGGAVLSVLVGLLDTSEVLTPTDTLGFEPGSESLSIGARP